MSEENVEELTKKPILKRVPGNPPIVIVAFDMNLYVASTVQELLQFARSEEAAGDKPVKHLLLNLERVDYIDSKALDVLITATRNCRESGGDSVCAMHARNSFLFCE
jgi:anti-anti-sigma factor